jgi:hypothetical protein
MRTLPLALLLVALAAPALASDGVLEINQTEVEAAGGFPYRINTPGNYVLTSDLTVTTDVTALLILTDDVTIDLNGFGIVGNSSCAPGSCVQGTASGVTSVPILPILFHNISVFGGDVSHFSGNCIRLGKNSRVERMRVISCGADGITISSGIVTGNVVSSVRHHGLFLGVGSIYSHNTVTETNLAEGTGRAVQGGRATAGNSCDDGSCSRIQLRNYYLTIGTSNGANALTACSAGFHMASLWEILDPMRLRYDVDLGLVPMITDTRAGGPLSGVGGWVRTGYTASPVLIDPGTANCDMWTSTSPDVSGSYVTLDESWDAPAFVTSPWRPTEIDCDASVNVWCVED